MKTNYLLATITAIIMGSAGVSCLAQRTGNTTPKNNLSVTDRMFVQDAINRNNEAMALAQAALQQSQKKEVQQIARQLMSDHRAAQKKLYTIAGINDTIPYSRSVMQPLAGSAKLPNTDNLDNRRNRTIASITNNTTANTTLSNTNGTNSNTVANSAGTINTQRQNGFDSASRFGTNQQFNGNTSIDNANGVNNSNRTDLASASGRATETYTVANSQSPVLTNQQTNTGLNNNTGITAGTVTNPSVSGTTGSMGSNIPDLPNRVTDTVRQTGSTAGFQNTGTNLSFPGNERFSKTTPATAPNNNAGSDYGVTGVPINNAQTNALNTAPYSNNDINSNSVQTGRVLPTSDPAAVINSSTASMRNKDAGFNNANTGTNGTVQQSGQLAADNANGVNRRTSQVINNQPNSSSNTSMTTTGNTNTAAGTNASSGAILAGRSRGNNNGANTTASSVNTLGSMNFYTEPFVVSSALNTLRTTSTDAFDAQWAVQMSTNQQTAVSLYQSVLRKVTNPQVKTYINAVLPLLRGHQFAITQWQTKQ